MEDKQNVVEKRIKPGVIRRRAKPGQAPEATEVQEAQVAQPTAEVVVESAPEVIAEVSLPPEPPQVPASAGIIKEPEPEVVVSVPESQSQPSQVLEEEIVPQVEAAPPPPPPVVEVKVSVPETAPVVEAKLPVKPFRPVEENKVIGPRALPEGPPVGTIIDLSKTRRPVVAPKSAAAPSEKPEASLLRPEEEKEKDDKNRRAPKKASKGQKDELDIEGFGRVSNVAQIARISTRTVVDRVFQPVRSGKRKRARTGKVMGKKNQLTQPKAAKRIIRMKETIMVSDLAQQLGAKSNEVIRKLMDLGVMATMNQSIDFDTASLLAQEYGWEVKRVGFEEEAVLRTPEDKEEDLVMRAPVVTVMGHVDHGKTSLLDAIRKTQVAEGEAGGITQHIGSYRILLDKGKEITFLDTPGHEAFTAMRARGAAVTDIVILVVAADDGVMPQTLEALNHAKAAGVPIIVAVNKMDKPDAKPDVVKRQLSEHGLLAEDWGGEALFVNVSAKTGLGLSELLESVFLQAEMLDLKANPNKLAKGVVVEAKLDKGRGPVATVLVQEGTLRVGDILVAGNAMGRIRAMINERGESLKEAGPSFPAEILGLDKVPNASDLMQALPDEKTAKQVVEHRENKTREEKMSGAGKISLEDLFQKMKSGEVKELPLILKADVQGSAEALQAALEKIPSEKAKVRILHAGVGGITESDVSLASASNGIIIGFNVRPDTKAREIAEREGIEVKVYKVIYEVLEDVQRAMEGLLEPTLQEKYFGRAEVRQVFMVSKVGAVAGCKVVDGKILSNAQVRLLRDNVIIHEGKLSSLKRFKEDAREVLQGFECGMAMEGFNDLKEGDVIECYRMEQVKTKLS